MRHNHPNSTERVPECQISDGKRANLQVGGMASQRIEEQRRFAELDEGGYNG
jgi:hypothetical protein